MSETDKKGLIENINTVKKFCNKNECESCFGTLNRLQYPNVGCGLVNGLIARARHYNMNNGGNEAIRHAVKTLEISSTINSIYTGYPDHKKVKTGLNYLENTLNPNLNEVDEEIEYLTGEPENYLFSEKN